MTEKTLSPDSPIVQGVRKFAIERGYSGYTETPAQIAERWARMQVGGYGWFPKTEAEKQQVADLMNVTVEG